MASLGISLVSCAPVYVFMCTGLLCRYCSVGMYMHVYRPEVNIRCLS